MEQYRTANLAEPPAIYSRLHRGTLYCLFHNHGGLGDYTGNGRSVTAVLWVSGEH